MHPVVRQLRHPGAGQAQEERRAPHQLLLRPEGDGPGRRLRQLHLRGQGHQGGARPAGPDRVLEPTDLPVGRNDVAGAGLPRPHRRRGDQVQQEVPDAGDRLMAERTSGDLVLSGVTRTYDTFTAVDNIDLTSPQGSFFALLGPSGCGKTTTLRMVAGLEQPTVGSISIGDRDITATKPYQRNVNTVFQNYALFPHLDILENVAFGLKRRGVRDWKAKAMEALELVELAQVARKKPTQLSGGMQQRVALARAVVNRPDVLLLDEPLGALDLKLRRQMQIELKRIQQEVGLTFVHVTHDKEEAMTMADTIAVMNAGRLQQVGDPGTLYEKPQSTFAANFLGQSNLLRASVTGVSGEVASLDVHGIPMTA